MKNYVVTQTKTFRFPADEWEQALSFAKHPRFASEIETNMVEQETGREENVDG